MLMKGCKRIVSFFATILFLLKKVPNAIRGRRFLKHADPNLFFIDCPCSLGDAVVAAVAAAQLYDGTAAACTALSFGNGRGEFLTGYHAKATHWCKTSFRPSGMGR